ncbi:MAG: PD-(D/E)XK nuclease family protein [Chloroflexota bacterium]
MHKTFLEHFDELMKEIIADDGKGKFRFNRSMVIASDIAGQYFCEKKIELEYLHGKRETEAKLLGTEGHEKLLEGSAEIEREEMFKKIFGKQPVVALEMLLLAKHKDALLGGKPDSVLFFKGFPLIIYEYKFSRRRIAYPSYHVQARTYGLLLENMGFNISRLFYAIVVADVTARQDDSLRENVSKAIMDNGFRETIINLGNATIFLHKFNHAEAEKAVDWALEFWQNKRKAALTDNVFKCRSCEYYKECND